MSRLELNEDGIREVCTSVEEVGKFKSKNIIKPETIGQRINYKHFNGLILQFNESLKIFKGKVFEDVITNKKLENYKDIFKEQNNLKTKKNILISYTKQELTTFGKLKPILSKKYNELYNEMTKIESELKENPLKNIKNIKSLITTRKNLKKSEKVFNQYKITNRKLKKDAEEKSGIFKDSTFLHTITRMTGILIKVSDGIDELSKNNKYAHLHSTKTIKTYLRALVGDFLNCLRRYNTFVREYENIKKREDNSSKTNSIETFKESCEKFKQNTCKLADNLLKQFQYMKIIRQTMMSWMEETQEETEKLKQSFMYDNDLGDNKHLENLAVTFTKVCISTAFCMNIDKLEEYISRNDEMKNMFDGSIARCFQFTFVKSISKSLSLSPIYTVIFSICQAVCILTFIMDCLGTYTLAEEEDGIETVSTALDMKNIQKEAPV